MKKALALVLAAGVFFTLSASANVFEKSSSTNPTPQTQCDIGRSAGQYVADFNTTNDRPYRENGLYMGSSSLISSNSLIHNGWCQLEIIHEYTQYRYNDGGIYDEKTVRMTDKPGGNLVEDDVCPPEDTNFTQHTFIKDGACYNPNELSENSSCPSSTSSEEYVLPASGTTSPHVCVSHSDGSRCSYNLSEDASYYTSDFENAQCYGQKDELPVPDSPPDGYCTPSGGQLMCNENRSNVCDSSGNCQSGCGSYSYDGVEAFVCFADDTDGDGVPNYSDTDIDGDGIPNTEDEDWDGDGINDPAYGSGRPGSAGTETGGNETGETGGNETGESGPGIDEIKDAFIEQGDFSTEGIEKLMSDARDSNNNAIDSLIESDQANFSNAIGESSISSDLDVSELFNSGCSASFKIPFSNSNLDMCEAADRARPFLYVIFALATFIFCTRQIVNTVRGTD